MPPAYCRGQAAGIWASARPVCPTLTKVRPKHLRGQHVTLSKVGLRVGMTGYGLPVESTGNNNADLDLLITDWLTVPDLAERLGTVAKSVRSAIADRRVVGVKRGPDKIFQIPAAFLIGAHRANPADVRPELDTGKEIIMPSLQGTITLLSDMGLDDAEILAWIFTVQDLIGERPIDALHTGNRSIVRRAAATLL